MEVLTGIITDAEVVSSTEVILDSKLPDTEINVTKSITAEVSPQNYVLSSGGMYGSGFTGAAPTWLLDAIQQELTTGTGSLLSVLQNMQVLLDSLQLGVNQNISQIESTILSQSALETSVVSRLDGNDAAILNLSTTRVTATEAQTVALQVQQSTFGLDASAFIGNIASTYVDANSAIAKDVKLMTAELNGVTASITTLDEIFVGKGTMLSQLEIETGVSVVDLQGQLDHTVDTWFYSITPTLLNKPAVDWNELVEKRSHNGDLYYDKATGIAYQYSYNGTTEAWVVVTDQLKIDSLYQASLRDDTLDGKRSVYYTATAPTPMAADGVTPIAIETGDLWINSTTSVTKIRSAGGLWVDITNTATENALIDLGTLQETNDGVVNTYYQRLAPTTGMSYGDWWVNVVEEHTGTVVPSLVNLPTSAWTTTVAKDSHLGDIYTKTDTLSKYRFKVAAGVYSWELIADVNTIVYATAWRYEDPDGLNKPGMTWVYKDPTQNILANNAVNSELAKRKIAGVLAGTTQINLSQHINGAGWTTDASLTNWISTVFDPFVAQMDNIIETHFGDVQPTLANTPASTWIDTATKDLHLGDVYYDSLSGIGYRFVVVGGVYSWSVISDSGVAAALEAASHAQDTADGKRRTFISGWDSVNLVWTPVLPIPPYDRGDLFTPLVDTVSGLDTFYKNEVYVCNVSKATGLTFSNGDFVAGTNAKVVEDALADLNSDIGLLKGLVDNKVETFMQVAPPHISPITLPITHVDVPEYDSYINDLWFSTATDGKTYIYKRTSTGDVIVNYGFITEAYNFPTLNNGLVADPLTSSRDLALGGVLQMPTGTNDYVYSWSETPVPKEVFDAIDGKKIIFTTMPSNYFVRDILIPAVTFVSGGITFYANEIYISSTDATVFDAVHWSKATKYTDDTVANTAVQNAETAQTTANTANNLLADIASDDKLTASEKQKVKLEWDLIVTEVPKVLANATSAGILVTDALYLAYSNVAFPYGKYQLLSTYITPLLVDLNVTSVIVGTTFRSTFKAYYDAKIELLLAISIKLKDKADAAQAKADGIANGTVAISLAAATVGGVALTTYVAGELDKEVVILSGTAAPTTSPTTPTGKLNDIYIQKSTATGTSGVVVDVVNTWKHNGTIWVAIGSNSNLTALADLTDGKRTIYSNLGTTPPSTGVKLNDMWIPSSNSTDGTTYISGEIYIYKTTGWGEAVRYKTLIANVQTQVDSKVDTYYQGTVPYANQTNVPKDIRGGDYWYCTVNVSTYVKGNVYKYVEAVNGSNFNYTWTLSADVTKSAFDQIDGKKTIFGGATAPTAIAVNDVWIPKGYVGTAYTNGFIYQWNGTTWADNVEYTDDTMATAMTATYYSALVPTVLTHIYLADGDQWIPPADTGVYKKNSIYTYLGGVWTATTTTSAEYAKNQLGATMYNSPNATTPVAIAPAVLAIGDLWVVTDRWYTNATTDSIGSSTRTTYGHLVRKYNGSTWDNLTSTQAKATELKWSAKSSKYITAPDGSITGFEMSDGSATNSAFTITADTFKVVASGQSVASKNPLTVDAATGEITFNGKVSFNSVTDVVVDSIDNINHIFEDWGTTYPTGYDVWAGTISKETSIIKNGANALKIVSTAGGNGGLNFNAPVLFKSPTNMDYDYITVSVDVYLESGTFAGSGIRIDWRNTIPTTYSTYIHFNLEFPSAATGKWYTVTKTIPKNASFTGTFSTMDGYIFGHYSVCNGGVTVANSIIVDRLTIRAATSAEVLSIGALPSSSDLAAIVNTGTTTINGGKITTGSITTDHIVANSIDATKLTVDALYGKSIVGASIVGGTINGAYIKGAIIEASYIIQADTTSGVSDYRDITVVQFVTFTAIEQSAFIAVVKDWASLAQYEKDYFSNNINLYKGRVPIIDVNSKCFLPSRSPCIWNATSPSVNLYFGAYNTGTIGASYFDFTPYDDYSSSSNALRCSKLNPTLTFSNTLIATAIQYNDKWAPCQIGIKMLDRVVVFEWDHGDGVLINGYRVYTTNGFPLTQNTTADGTSKISTLSQRYSYGTATQLSSDVIASYGRMVTYSYGAFTLSVEIGFVSTGGSGIKVSLSSSSTQLFNFTRNNIMATDPKAYGVLFLNGGANHTSVGYSFAITMPQITVS